MKKAFRLSRASVVTLALALFFCAIILVQAQTVSNSPDPFVVQITSTSIPPVPASTASPTPTPAATPTPTPSPTPLQRDSHATDMTGDGRFVVIESEGDISTERSDSRNNRDGNPEIFLFDYAQRRIFQITDTRSALKSATASPIDPANIEVQVVNLRPQISHDGRYIVFLSNAYVDAPGDADPNPSEFDGNTAANLAGLKADGNTEIFIYQVPEVAAADLTSGAEVPRVELTGGAMTRVTTTPASRTPTAGFSTTVDGVTFVVPPFFARDNDSPSVNDDGSLVAFVSQSKSGITATNADGNQEIFLWRRESGAFVQVTQTADKPATGNTPGTLVFNTNPSLSACAGALACRLAFLSNSDVGSDEAAANQGNGEIYVTTVTGATVGALAPATKTPPERRIGFEGTPVNFLGFGRRLSRDGQFLAFESSALFGTDGTLSGGTNGLANTYGIYIFNTVSRTFAQVASRVPDNQAPDLANRFPTFTGDSTRVVWASDLNVKPDGTIAAFGAAEGLNPARRTQIFTAPVAATNQVSVLTRNPTSVSGFPAGARIPVQPLPSDTIRRVAFSMRGTELGGGNADGSSEAFYLLVPAVTSETPAPSPSPAASPAQVSFFTGASDRPVVSPSPSPTPPAVSGLAPGMLGIARSPLALAPSEREVDKNTAHETNRRPPLPVELNGVSVSINNAAAGLYFVAPGQINFVVPPGLAASTTPVPVVINNNGAVIRTSLLLNAAQPDLFTSTNGEGGRAAVLNVTNPCVEPPGEPFTVMTTRPKNSGTTGDCSSPETEAAPTRLLILLTGLPDVVAVNNVTVRIGTTDIVGTTDPATSPIKFAGSTLTPGFDQITVDLPASLAGAGDVPVIVIVNIGNTLFSSRPAETAPRITILPNP